MLIFKILISGLFLKSFFCTKPGARILGGQEVQKRSDFPYQVLIVYQNRARCGGTIIDEKHVLTAAHCCLNETYEKLNASELFISVGNLLLNDTSNIKKIEKVEVHENFIWNPIWNDIALLRIVGTFEFIPDKIQPIKLTTKHLSSGTCRISGWGMTSDDHAMSFKLHYAEIGLVDWNICNQMYIYLANFTINDKIICGGSYSKSASLGDSGGPLVCFGRLTGIISAGGPYLPCLYTEVAKYLDWIAEKTGNPSLVDEPLLNASVIVEPLLAVMFSFFMMIFL